MLPQASENNSIYVHVAELMSLNVTIKNIVFRLPFSQFLSPVAPAVTPHCAHIQVLSADVSLI